MKRMETIKTALSLLTFKHYMALLGVIIGFVMLLLLSINTLNKQMQVTEADIATATAIMMRRMGIVPTFTLLPTLTTEATPTPTPTQPNTSSPVPFPTITPQPTQLFMTAPPAIMTPSLPTPSQNLGIIPTIPPNIPTQINGIPYEQFIVLPDEVVQHIREIAITGRNLGRNPHAFSKLGDSTIDNPYFLARFDGGDYNLGDYAYLQAVIDYYAGSFGRQSAAVRVGLHTWSVMDSMWANHAMCNPGEHMLACEIRLNNPSIIFIRLGSNDRGVPGSVESSLREIIQYCIENGVIPVLGTKADRFEGMSNINNTIIRQLAAEYAVPLWDYDLLAGTIPGRGLDSDGVHLTTFFVHDYTQPLAFQRGHSVHNLSALVMLDHLMRLITCDTC